MYCTWCKHAQRKKMNVGQSSASNLVQALQLHFEEAFVPREEQSQSQILYTPPAGQPLDC